MIMFLWYVHDRSCRVSFLPELICRTHLHMSMRGRIPKNIQSVIDHAKDMVRYGKYMETHVNSLLETPRVCGQLWA
jgi:hypothetical protein